MHLDRYLFIPGSVILLLAILIFTRDAKKNMRIAEKVLGNERLKNPKILFYFYWSPYAIFMILNIVRIIIKYKNENLL